jgi:hypothetical protein
MIRFLFFVVVCLASTVACNPPPFEENQYKTEKRYPHPPDLITDAAWVVNEYNGRLIFDRDRNIIRGGYGSGFLRDKEKGLFYSNKHVTDVFGTLGGDSHKIFFNGSVYNASVLYVHELADAAIFKITDPFDASDFPDPIPFATEKLVVGDKVYLEGFHVHPYNIREANKERDIEYTMVPIMRDYYESVRIDTDHYSEVVFENIEATITEIDINLKIGSEGPSNKIDRLRGEANLFIKATTEHDHLFSFGGLSGSAVKNEAGEIVGILTAESRKYETDPESLDPDSQSIVITKFIFNEVIITSIEELESLHSFIAGQ